VINNEPDVCACDICQSLRDYHALSTEEKFEQVFSEKSERTLTWWRKYAEQLEAENYDLTQQVAELEQELSEESARCSACGKHK